MRLPAGSVDAERAKYPQFAGLQWTVDMAVVATALSFATSTTAMLALWSWGAAALHEVTGPRWAPPPAGLAALPLAWWWVRFIAEGAPYVTSDQDRLVAIRAIVAKAIADQRAADRRAAMLSADGSGDIPVRTADLGSGDGRLLVELAAAGADRVDGYEINPALVAWSRWKLAQAGLGSGGGTAGCQIAVHHTSMFSADLSSYSVLVCFQYPSIMERLEEKLRTELKAGAVVVSNTFAFPTWEPTAVVMAREADDSNDEEAPKLFVYTQELKKAA